MKTRPVPAVQAIVETPQDLLDMKTRPVPAVQAMKARSVPVVERSLRQKRIEDGHPVHNRSSSTKVFDEHKAAARPSRLPLRIIAISLAPIAICINFSNYGSLIPLLQNMLHVDSGQIGLFSTLLFLGIALTNIPGGILADRFGSRVTMLGSLVPITAGMLLFPLFPNFTWMVICRAIIGLGSGAALVAASHATAELGKYSDLGQGLNGGAAQLGACLGIFVTPQLLGLLSWQGTLLIDVIPGILCILIWWWMPRGSHEETGAETQQNNPAAGIRSPVIWSLGLANMGTFGLGNAISAWLTVYFLNRYGVPLGQAALFGSLGVFAGIFFRPLGGVLLARWQRPVLLIRLGTVLAFVGLGLLALPIASLPLAISGLLLFAIGITVPYASIFSTAAQTGGKTSIGSGVAQGLSAVLAAPAAIIGTPLIGLLLEHTNSFPVAFGSVGLIIAGIGVVAALLLSPALRQISYGSYYKRVQHEIA